MNYITVNHNYWTSVCSEKGERILSALKAAKLSCAGSNGATLSSRRVDIQPASERAKRAKKCSERANENIGRAPMDAQTHIRHFNRLDLSMNFRLRYCSDVRENSCSGDSKSVQKMRSHGYHMSVPQLKYAYRVKLFKF